LRLCDRIDPVAQARHQISLFDDYDGYVQNR